MATFDLLVPILRTFLHGLLIPLYLPTNIRNVLQRLPHLHHSISYQPRVQLQRPLDLMLRLHAAVEAHDEVMPGVMQGLVAP